MVIIPELPGSGEAVLFSLSVSFEHLFCENSIQRNRRKRGTRVVIFFFMALFSVVVHLYPYETNYKVTINRSSVKYFGLFSGFYLKAAIFPAYFRPRSPGKNPAWRNIDK